MKKPFLGLRTVVYKVEDLIEAKKWYSQAFQTQPYFDEAFYVGFNIAGYELGLITNNKHEKQKTENTNLYWGVEDVEKQYQRLIKLGATEYEKPHNVGGEIIVGGVKDPWGNIIGFIYNPLFKL